MIDRPVLGYVLLALLIALVAGGILYRRYNLAVHRERRRRDREEASYQDGQDADRKAPHGD